jgi:lysophospholipase L1-like esterase
MELQIIKNESRGHKIMTDFDLAKLYQVKTKYLKRNIEFKLFKKMKTYLPLLILFFIIIVIGCKKTSPLEEQSPTEKICFLGNSLTYGGNWVKITGNDNCVNMGISGNVSNDVKNRLNEVVTLNPCKIFLMIGINDLRRGINIDEIETNVAYILSFFSEHLPKTQIFLQSILPTTVSANSSNIINLNEKYKDLVEKNSNSDYINLYDQFVDTKNLLQPELSTDGLHLSEKGYILWAAIIKPYL